MTRLWSNARLIIRLSEHKFEHRRNFYAIDLPPAMRIMQAMRGDYERALTDLEAENETLRARVTELETEKAREYREVVTVRLPALKPAIPAEIADALRRAAYAMFEDAMAVKQWLRNVSVLP